MTTVPIWALDTVSIHLSNARSMPIKAKLSLSLSQTPSEGFPCEKDLGQVSSVILRKTGKIGWFPFKIRKKKFNNAAFLIPCSRLPISWLKES